MYDKSNYDAAGDVTYDGINSYLYDAEGRLCAVKNSNASLTGYIYDAAGTRVAKGSLSSFSCNFSSNGFLANTSWVLGPGGEQVTEYAVSGPATNYTSSWTHTNAFSSGKITATYHDTGTYFYLGDWLGTKRAEVGQMLSSTNTAQLCAATFASLPYGDGLTSAQSVPGYQTCPDATEHHFTGKERDAESGNDYFGARYYASSMGRFMSPDWSAKIMPVPYASLGDPQSLNLYSYVLNNPLIKVDPNGHDWFYVDKKWQWQKGSTFHNADGSASDAKGYGALLVATKTGIDKKTGATRFSLTLYDQNEVVATGSGFSGGGPRNYGPANGNFEMHLGLRDPKGPSHLNAAGDNLPHYDGIQKIYDFLHGTGNPGPTDAYGTVRAFLDPLENQKGSRYFHGQEDGYGWTHGCLSYGMDKDHSMRNALWNLPAVESAAAVNRTVEAPQ